MLTFRQLIDLLPDESRSIQVNPSKYTTAPVGECFFGVPADERYGRALLREMPAATSCFNFLLGQQLDLVKGYCKSSFPAQTKTLRVGYSSYFQGENQAFDYRMLVNILSEVQFPKLKCLELGLFEAFCNMHGPFGFLGEISHLVSAAPNLEELRIYGNWTMDRVLDFSNLKCLEVWTCEKVANEDLPPIDKVSMANFFNSKMPIDPIEFWMFFHDMKDFQNRGMKPLFYDIPANFWNWQPKQHIESFVLNGCFTSESRDRFVNSNLATLIDEENYKNSMMGIETPGSAG